jgi:hypothetical protein
VSSAKLRIALDVRLDARDVAEEVSELVHIVDQVDEIGPPFSRRQRASSTPGLGQVDIVVRQTGCRSSRHRSCARAAHDRVAPLMATIAGSRAVSAARQIRSASSSVLAISFQRAPLTLEAGASCACVALKRRYDDAGQTRLVEQRVDVGEPGHANRRDSCRPASDGSAMPTS